MEDINNKQNAGQPKPAEKSPQPEARRRGYNYGNLFLGLVVVSIGIIYLSKNYGWIPDGLNIEIFRLWPLLVIALGLSLLDSRGFLSNTAGFLIFLIVIAVTSFIIFYGLRNSPQPVFKETPFKIEVGEKTNYSDLSVKSGVGKVDISGDSGLLAEGNLKSSISSLKIKNDTSGERQKLSLETENTDGRVDSLSGVNNDLEVKLNGELPTDLSLNLGVSDSNLDLSQVQVNNLNIDIGISKLELRLGDRAENAKVNLKSGMSTIKISLPESVGSKVITGGGLSSNKINDLKKIDDKTFQTENYDRAQKKIEIILNTGFSNLEIGTYKP